MTALASTPPRTAGPGAERLQTDALVLNSAPAGVVPMIIGVPKEIKPDEYRVALTPAGVERLKRGGHTVVIERGAGVGSGIGDEDYETYGAEMVASASEVWERAELICKVKEPLAPEIAQIRENQVVFTYFHFAASRELTEGVRDSNCVAIAYETIEDRTAACRCWRR
jgi:alanine dehydrogenase